MAARYPPAVCLILSYLLFERNTHNAANRTATAPSQRSFFADPEWLARRQAFTARGTHARAQPYTKD